MSVRDRLSSLLVLHSAGTDAAALRAFVSDNRPGGLIFMGDNIGSSTADVASLAAAVQTPEHPMILAVDQEGGVVSRLPGDDGPAGSQLAAQPVSATTEAFERRAEIVRDAGLNTNFGIVADITDDADSFIHSRTLGATPAEAADRVAAAVRAEAKVGVLSTLKHFPGHGAAPGDSHTSLPTTSVSRADWLARDAVPFQAGIEAGAEMVMLGHLVFSDVDELPASVSPAWHQILRDDMGFDGLIVSDDLGMLENSGEAAFGDRVDNAVRALTAGTTMLVIVADGPNPVSPARLLDGLVAAVDDGRLPESVVDDAATRVWDAREGLVSSE